MLIKRSTAVEQQDAYLVRLKFPVFGRDAANKQNLRCLLEGAPLSFTVDDGQNGKDAI